MAWQAKAAAQQAREAKQSALKGEPALLAAFGSSGAGGLESRVEALENELAELKYRTLPLTLPLTLTLIAELNTQGG